MSDPKNKKTMTRADLDQLLREVARREEKFEPPSDAALDRYVEGTAAPEDRASVESAMALSARFREEVMARSAITHRSEEFASLTPPPAPPLPTSRPRRLRSTWHRRRGIGLRPTRRSALWVVPAGIAALAVAWITLQPGQTQLPEELTLVAGAPLIDEQFEADLRRTQQGGPSVRIPLSHREAAIHAFRDAVEWQEGEYQITASRNKIPGRSSHRVRVEGLAKPHDFRAVLPADASDVRAAVLLIPSLDLLWAPLDGPSGRLRVPPQPGGRACVTLTYVSASGYEATPAAVFPND